jgi:hypothetical protein
MNKFYQISEMIKLWIEKILGTMSAVLMIFVTLFALAEIFRRYILGVVFEWGQDAVIYATMCSVAFFICVTQIKRGHLVMSAVLQLLSAYNFFRSKFPSPQPIQKAFSPYSLKDFNYFDDTCRHINKNLYEG